MAKSDLGTKRICPTTGKKFYDLNKNPVISPYTGEVVPIAPVAPPRAARGDAARAAAAASATAAADQPEAAEAEELVSLEEADAEENTGKVKAVVPESEDDIEIDETIEDDDDDDSTFIRRRGRRRRGRHRHHRRRRRRRRDLRSALNCVQGLARKSPKTCGRMSEDRALTVKGP